MANYQKAGADNNQIRNLNASEIQHPIVVMHEFFQQYDLTILRERLWQWYATAMSSDITEFPKGIDRSSLLLLYEHLLKLAEAAYLVQGRKGNE